MKNNILYLFASFICCMATAQQKATIEELIENLTDSKNKEIMVVAHRGDWRNAPENSLQAIQFCIDMGVDMVEIDIQKTLDGHIVLMHDKSINRTTNKKGNVKEMTLEQLKKAKLTDGLGRPTPNHIPTLEEAMLVAKGKILVNLDKAYPIIKECYPILKKTKTLDHVVFKGEASRGEVEQYLGSMLEEIHYMPQIKQKNPKGIAILDDFLENGTPVAFAFGLPKEDKTLQKRFKDIREQGVSIWLNSLWPRHNAGHNDEKAIVNPKIYDWYIDNHIDIIQTDRPGFLIEYLRKKGLHR